jgi:hypothetical protein
MFVQNNDIRVFFLLSDETGAAVPASSLYDYHVYIYRLCDGQKILVAVYKKNNIGLYSIKVDSSVANKISVIINRDITKNIDPKDLFAQVDVQVTQTADFINNVANLSVTDLSLFKLRQSANKNGLK